MEKMKGKKLSLDEIVGVKTYLTKKQLNYMLVGDCPFGDESRECGDWCQLFDICTCDSYDPDDPDYDPDYDPLIEFAKKEWERLYG